MSDRICPLTTRTSRRWAVKRVKVLFFSHQGDYIYGGEVSTFAFMKELKSAGVEVHFASPEGVVSDRALELADKVHIVPAVQFSRDFRHLPRLLPALKNTRGALAEVVQREKIDLVHAMSLKAMAYAALLRKVPVLWHHRDILPSGLRNEVWLRLFAARARRILVPSEATRQSLLSAGIGEDKVGVLLNGLDGSLWGPRPARDDSETLTVGFVGELSERKGIDLLPALLEALEKAGVSTHWKIVGGALSNPALADQLLAELAPRIAAGQVEFLGRREDVRDIFQSFDVLWVPSRQEPSARVLIEAAFSGVPVVASPVGGIPETVENERTGFLAKDLAETVTALANLADKEVWECFSRAARASAEERFDIRRATRNLAGVYNEILK